MKQSVLHVSISDAAKEAAMRTIMLVASVAMILSGIFCVANSSAAFLSVAFIIGLVLLLLGTCEIIIGRRADFDRAEVGIGLTKDGILLFIVGLVIFGGQITDDTSSLILFGILLLMEGVMSFRTDWLDVTHIARGQRINMTICVIMIVIGTYMFFNTAALRIPVTLLIGLALIVLGLRRFMQSFTIEYIRPSFITGNEERLKEAQEEEKRALAKAKEGIREQKTAQRRIRKIEEDIAAEQDLIMEAQIRKKEREAETKLEQESEAN